MCGTYYTTINYHENKEKARLNKIAFRGLDFMSVQSFKSRTTKVVFGNNLLTVLDLDAGFNQPFTYANHIQIVFNGEIYNYPELKTELRKKGHRFRTTSDTEVTCTTHLESGEECPRRLNGMFAFVIYDANQKLFVSARNRLGQKPFYYYDGKQFEFGSQVSQIQLNHKSHSVSEMAIDKFFIRGNILPI